MSHLSKCDLQSKINPCGHISIKFNEKKINYFGKNHIKDYYMTVLTYIWLALFYIMASETILVGIGVA